ncbi:hypothetical protein CL617_03755 [archaeon]|nr:hypothetical protein [archaeon]|tara:strand:+ start:4911 stop:5387 length:477 start_codon:yes stop_codon:yes gene_type:complete
MNKKGIMQINETIIVLIVFSIILILSITIFYRYNIASVEDLGNEFERNRVLNLLSTLPNDPNVVYSNLGQEENSIDTSKLVNLKLEKLGFMEIRIREIYPLNSEGVCDASNYPDCNEFVLYDDNGNKENVNILTTPISLYYPGLKEYKSGVLEIKWFN